MIRLSLSDQTSYFLWSLVMGAVLAAVYDLVRAVRMTVKARGPHIIVTDILFFALCGILTSLFALPFNKGSVRAFIIFGEAVGFLAYRLTLGSIMGKIYSHLARFLRKILQKVHKFSEKFFDLLLKITSLLVYNVNVLIEHSRKAAAVHIKKRRKAGKTFDNGASGDNKGRLNEQKKRKKAKHLRRKNRAQRYRQ